MAGRRFGPYELEELLGRGGMGEVWRAVDTRKSRTVALKLLPSELTGDGDIEERFRREAHVAARLNDPHVIPIHDYGELHGRLYLDMRLVQGVDLARTLKTDGALAPSRAVSIIGQVADALDAAHDDGLVHRDVKPSNILLTASRRGSDDFVYLIDFGIAAGSMLGTRLTATGHAVGTAAYMAPERFTEDRDADRRVDVYALGCVLHEMLTGSTPFPGTSFPNLMYQHLNAPPPRPSTSGELPTGFDEVVTTALSKNPDQRHRRAGDLADAARAALLAPQPVRATPVPSTSTHRPSSASPRASGPSLPPPSPHPTRVAPPPTRSAPDDPSPHRWDLAPDDAPREHARAETSASTTRNRDRRRSAAAITAIVFHGLWAVLTVAGTAFTFSHCGASAAACAGGVVGLLSISAGVVGVAAAVSALRGRAGRGVAVAWISFAAAFVLLLVTAGLDGVATG